MKKSLTVLIIFLIFWYALSTYWYVCRIRLLCMRNGHQASFVEAIGMLIHAAGSTDNSSEQVVQNRLIYFDPDSADVSPRYNGYLSQVAAYMKTHPRTYVRLVGYAAYSSEYADDSHVVFSRARAQSVSTMLVRQGVNQDHITIEGRGYKEAAAANDTEDGRAKNRRVEVIFYHY